MGQSPCVQYCLGSNEQTQSRLAELRQLLNKQNKFQVELTTRIEQIKEEHHRIELTNENQKIQQNIELLSNEKRHVFKGLLKEQKKKVILEDAITEYKEKLKGLQKEYDILEKEEKKRERRKKRQSVGTVSKILDKYGISRDLDVDAIDQSSSTRSRGSPSLSQSTATSKPPSIILDINDNKNIIDDLSDYDDNDDEKLERSTTLVLDARSDPSTDAVYLNSMLSRDIKGNKDRKELKRQLASLLTARSEPFRLQLIDSYYKQCGRNLEKDLLAKVKKGNSMIIISHLLMTSAQMDALIISRFVANWDIQSVAEIVCCRTKEQIKDLHEAYKKKCKLNIRDQLRALAIKDNKNTLAKVIDNIFNLNLKKSEIISSDQIISELDFLLNTKSFKKDTKERFCFIFTGSTAKHIQALNAQYKLKKKDELVTFIDKKLGRKSIAGYYCKVAVEYSLGGSDYFAKKVKKLGWSFHAFRKNQEQIAELFIQRLEVDLYSIKRTFINNNYGGGRTLKNWVTWRTNDSCSGYFLQKMLDNCERYSTFNKAKQKQLQVVGVGVNKLL